MGVGDKLWDALTTVIKMNDRIVSQSEQMRAMQAKIEDLTGRVIRLETALEIALAAQSRKRLDRKS